MDEKGREPTDWEPWPVTGRMEFAWGRNATARNQNVYIAWETNGGDWGQNTLVGVFHIPFIS